MKRITTLIAICCAAGANAEAAGFEASNLSGAAAGVSNAFVATADDASAAVYNPAGVAWQSGVTLTLGTRMDYRDSSVRLANALPPNSGANTSALYGYLAYAPLDRNWALTGGIAPLYQLDNDWTGAFATSGISRLTVDHASLDYVYAINSSLAVGLGGDWYITRADFTQPGKSFKGTDYGAFGGHLSAMWKPAQGWSVGALYRSGAKVAIAGKYNDNLSFKLPDMVSAGVAHDFADVWKLEVDGKWTRWSALKSFNVVKAGAIDQANALSLRNTFAVMAGLTWTWRPESKFRIGYAYDQGANKLAGFNPVMADQTGHNISLGASGNVFGFNLDLAYNYTIYSKKQATGTYAGTYRDRRQALTISSTWVF